MSIEVDIPHLEEHGWVLIEKVVPAAETDAVVDLLCTYLDVPRDHCIADFKRTVGEIYNGIVPIHQHQALWDTRQSALVHEAFSQVYEDSALWVTMDRASYKPTLSPRAKATKGDPNRMHVDSAVLKTSLRPVQGVLYLTDTDEYQGAWECIPELYREVRTGQRPKIRQVESVAEYEIVRVPAPAGSLVIWDERLPHSSGHNWTDIPRFAQYITMHPAGDETDRASRIAWWQDRRAPDYWRGMPNQPDPEPWEKPADLTELGEKLLGSLPWAN